MAKQSQVDRMRRLDKGCCPIHGIAMTQVDQWYYVVESGPPLGLPMTEADILSSMKKRTAYTIVECPREDCDVRATSRDGDGPCDLLPEWQHLLTDVR